MPIIGPSGTTLYGNGLNQPYLNPGAPGANFLAGTCVVGSLLIDTSAGQLWQCTATNGTSTATWVKVGSQV
jgi:hypothetical protein